MAHGDPVALTKRLHAAAAAYASFPPEHLTFEEIQQVLSGDTQAVAAHDAHLEACEFCSGLRETLATPDASKQAFADLVKSYERAPEPNRDEWRAEIAPPAAVRTTESNRRSVSRLRLSLALASVQPRTSNSRIRRCGTDDGVVHRGTFHPHLKVNRRTRG